MKQLIELTLMLDNYKLKRIPTLDNPANDSSLYAQFYKGLKAGKIKSDEEAKAYLYQKGCSHGAYQRLKYRFRQRLLNTLFFVDVNKPQFNNCQSAYYNCYTELAQVHILLGRGCRLIGISLAEKTLPTAIRFEFTELAYSLCRLLRTHYATLEGNAKKTEYYIQLCQRQLTILSAEEKAELHYAKVLSYFVKTRSKKPERIQQIQNAITALQPYLGEVNTNNFIVRYYTLLVLQYETQGQMGKIGKVCKLAIKILEQKDFVAKKVLFTFYARLLSIYLLSANYKLAEELLTACEKLVVAGETNWFIFQNIRHIFFLHQKRYQEAYQVYVAVNSDEHYILQNEVQQEHWRICRAYLFILFLMGKIKDPEFIFKKFRLQSFLNDVPIFRKDKRGMNITILIAQFLILLQQKKYNRIIDTVEGLRQYTGRYLRRNDTFRSNCFIHMLTRIPEGNFHPVLVEARARKHRRRLAQMPLDERNLSNEIELIPYEDLWQLALECL